MKRTILSIIVFLAAATVVGFGIWTYLLSIKQVPEELPNNTFLVEAAQNSVIEFDGIRLEIPAGSVLVDTKITINKTNDRNLSGGLTDVFDLQPEGLVFDHWVRLSLPFNPDALTAKTPRINLKYTLADGREIELPFEIDWVNNRLRTWIKEF